VARRVSEGGAVLVVDEAFADFAPEIGVAAEVDEGCASRGLSRSSLRSPASGSVASSAPTPRASRRFSRRGR
jgi:hypothetical protein